MDNSLSIETLMMLFFIAALGLSIWKLYAFMPNKKLIDDDTDATSKAELTALMLQVIVKSFDDNEAVMLQKLYQNMIKDPQFDAAHYWRFNPNRLNHIIQAYLLEHSHCHSLKDIYNTQVALIETNDASAE